MKKITLIFFSLFVLFSANAQVGIIEGLNSATIPTGWIQAGGFGETTTTPCEGSRAWRDNLYGFSTTGTFTSPNYVGASNGTDVTVTFEWKATEWSAGDGVGFTVNAEYSTDNGTTWLSIGDPIVASGITECAEFSSIIPAASLPEGSDFKFRVRETWVSGDCYFWIDNINITQVTALPPNCDAALVTPADGSTDANLLGVLSWSAATGLPSSYVLSVGTTTGGTDVVNALNVGLTTSYDVPGILMGDTTYYVSITPVNPNGSATGCTEYSFTTGPAPVEGTLCENAIVVDALPFSASDTTANYSDVYYEGSPGATGCSTTNGYLNGNDVVYSYTATFTGSVKIILTPEAGNTYGGLFIYTNCNDIGVSCVNGVSGSGATPKMIEEFEVVTGQTYYMVISTWASPQNIAYTLDITENTCSNGAATYTVVPDCAEGEQFLVEVEITDLGSAESMTILDDQGSATQTASAIGTFTFGPYPNANPVIFTVVNDQDDYCTLTSPALNQLACPPANDECSGAEVLTVNPEYVCDSITSSTLAGATASTVVGNTCFGNPNDDVWFSFEATAASHRISLLNVLPVVDLYHSLWTGGCEGLTLVAGSCSDGNTSNPAGLVAGQIYYVRVYSYGAASTSSTFDICIGTPPPPPSNDTCEGAIDLTNETSPLSSTTEGATNTNTTVCSNSGEEVANTHPDVYYSIVVPSGSTLTIGQTVNNYDSANVVFYGDCDNRTSIACFDDADDTQVVWANDTGSEQTVYWVQDGWGGNGTFTLAWSVVACTPAEATYTVVSDCANGEQFLVDVDVTNMGSATSITVFDDQGSAPQTVSATGIVTFGPYANATPVIFTVVNDQDDNCTLTSPIRTQAVCPPNCEEAEIIASCDEEYTAVFAAGNGAWNVSACGFSTPGVENIYSFTPTETGAYELEVVSVVPNFSYVDYFYKEADGNCTNTGWTCIDDLSTASIRSIGTLTAGVEYLFLLDSEGNTARTHTFKIKCLPSCTNGTATYTVVSDCENGEQFMVDVNVTSLGTAASVTVSDDQGSAPQNATATGILTFGPYPNNNPVIFTVANDEDETCVWTSGAVNQQACPPANDLCVNAVELTAGAAFEDYAVVGTSISASRDAADPVPTCDNLNFATNGRDVWYTVTVPASGSLIFETKTNAGTALTDTGLQVYSGTCGAIVSLGCNADDGDGNFSKLTLTDLTPGEVLLLRVWGYNGSSGTFMVAAHHASLSASQFDGNTFKAYPNPVKDVLNLSYTQNISNVEVFNMLGQQVIAKSVNATQGQVDMSNLSAGSYLVRITADNQVKTIKVIKQ